MLIETNFGIAYRYGKTIEINPVLKKYPKLYEKVLNHEIGHTQHKKMDFWHDFTSNSFLSWQGLKFMARHPIISLQLMMPVWFHNGELNWNTYLLVYYPILFLAIAFLMAVIL